MALRLPSIKAGAPFSVYVEYLRGDAVESFPDSDLRAQVRDRAQHLLSELMVTADPQAPGRKWLSAASTAHWPPGEVYFDLFRANCATPYTETITVPVSRAQTRAPSTAVNLADEALDLPSPAGSVAPLGFAAGSSLARVVLGMPGVQRTIVVAQAKAGSYGAAPRQIRSAEALEPGDYLHIDIDSAGAPRVRKAGALLGLEAHGFTRTACAADAMATVYGPGDENYAAASTPGVRWLGSAPGKCQAEAPMRQPGVRALVQRVGVSMAAGVVHFWPGDVTRLAAST